MSASDAERRVADAGGRPGGRSRRLGRRPNLQRARERRADRAGHPGGAAGGLAADRRRRLAGRDRGAGRHDRCTRAARLGAAPRRQGGPRRRLPRRLPMGPRASGCAGRRADGRRLQPRSGGPAAAPGAAHARRGPRARHALHAGWRHGRLAVAPEADQPWRDALRAHGAPAALPRPDRRLQGLAARAARRDPAARDGRARATDSRWRRRGGRIGVAHRIVQVPIVFRERVAGASKMTGGIVREALLLVLRLRLGRHPRRDHPNVSECASRLHRLAWRLASPSGREGRS